MCIKEQNMSNTTTAEKTLITIETTVDAPIEAVWKCWTSPEDITKWNFAADTWQCPTAENDLRPDGKFSYRMEAKDGSFGFDFSGTYTQVNTNELIEFLIGDGRFVSVAFSPEGNQTKVTESFEPETQNPVEMQRGGWQAILDNFKKHVEKTAG